MEIDVSLLKAFCEAQIPLSKLEFMPLEVF
jgi:hypothetical protein